MLLLYFGNTKQKLQSPFGIAFLPEFRNGACLLGTVPYIVRHFSACVLCFGTELDGIVFLTLRLYADVPKEKHKKKAIFWILPLFSLGMGIFFCLRGSYFENILMGTAMGILGFYAVKGIYFAKIQKQTGKLWIFAAALIFYAAEYLLWGSSYFIAENTFINPYYLVDIFIMNPALILIAVAQSREEKLCRTI